MFKQRRARSAVGWVGNYQAGEDWALHKSYAHGGRVGGKVHSVTLVTKTTYSVVIKAQSRFVI